MATEKVALSTNTLYGAVTAVTLIAGVAVASVIYLTGREISALEERCNSLEKRVEYLDEIVKERNGNTKELFDAKLASLIKNKNQMYARTIFIEKEDSLTK